MPVDTAIPDTNDALVEALTNKDTVKARMGDEASMKAYLADSVKAIVARDKGAVDGQVAEQGNQTIAEMIKDQLGLDVSGNRPGMGGKAKASMPSNSLKRAMGPLNHKAPGAGLDDYYNSHQLHPGHFLQAAVRGRKTDGVDGIEAFRSKIEEVTAAYGSEVGSEGGYLLPEQLRSELLTEQLETATVRPRATIMPMSTRTLRVPSIDVTSHASSYFGGVSMAWGDETSTLVETNAAFGDTKLEVNPLTGMTRIPLDHLNDTQFVGAYFSATFPQALTAEEDFQFLVGNGVGKPQGMLNSSAAVSVAKESGQPADTIVFENVAKMYARMIPSALNTAVWVIAPNVLPELFTMALSVGTGGSAIWMQNAAGSAPVTIFGRPVIVSPNVPTVGDLGDISFVDFSKYLIGDRQTMTIDDTDQEAWLQRKRSFRIVSRVDGRSWVKSALTLRNGSADTVSPVVKLAERA